MPGPVFIAEFRSDCADCDEPLERGQVGRMTYDGPAHDECPRPAPASRPACPRCFLVHATAQEDCE